MFPVTPEDYIVLRHVKLDDITLMTWQTGRQAKTGQELIGYRLSDEAGGIIFEGEDCGVAPSDCIDSDASLRGLLSFLSCKPGDVDEGFFKDYTPEQIKWVEDNGDSLSIWAEDADGDYPAAEFIDIDGCHECGMDPHDKDCEKAKRIQTNRG